MTRSPHPSPVPKLRLLLTLAGFLVVCLAHSNAWAQLPWRPNIAISPLTVVTETIAPGVTRTYETRASSTGCDPVIQVWREGSLPREVAMNDDWAGTAEARVSVVNSTTSTMKVIVVVRAMTSRSGGTTNLYRDGALWRSAQPVGGAQLTVVAATNLSHETAPTALTPAVNVVLAGLDASGHLLSLDIRGSGVGAQGKILGSPTTTTLLIGTSDGASGRVNVVTSRTTTGSDLDNDGLDDLVEAVIGTCTTELTCPHLWRQNPADTDHDGLSDGVEVFGIEGTAPSGAVLLPLWGASPMHKDVFVEIDNELPAAPASAPPNPYVALSAAQIASWLSLNEQPYAAAPAGTVGNPDGRDGVAVHFDIGVPCPAQGTKCGNFGGGATGIPFGTTRTTATATPSIFQQNRIGIFHYGINTIGGGGNAGVLANTLVGDFDNPGGNALAHELGHNLGINHGGHPKWDGDVDLNNKYNYPSLMSYGRWPGFSLGENPLFANAAHAAERWVFVGPCEAATHSATLALSPFSWLAEDATCSIDFNRDGVFTGWLSPPYPRSPLRWMTTSADHTLSSDRIDQYLQLFAPPGPGAALSPVGTPALVRLDVGDSSRLYLFQLMNVGGTTVLRVKQGATGSLGSGSCPNGDDVISAQGGLGCMNWGAWRDVAIAGTATSVSAAAWGSKLVVAYTDATGQVRSLYSRTISRISSSFGEVLNWSTPAVDATGITPGTEVELAVVPVSPEVFGAELSLQLIYLKPNLFGSTSTFYGRTTSRTVPLWSSEAPLVDDAGSSFVGAIGADVSAWPSVDYPDLYADIATACGAFPNATGQVDIRCLVRGSANFAWVKLTTVFGPTGAGAQPSPTVVTKPALQYHILRQSSGAPMFTNYDGQFWLAYVGTGVNGAGALKEPWISISAPLRTLESPESAIWNFPTGVAGRWCNAWSYAAGNGPATLPATAGSGVTLLEDLHLGALKGAWVEQRVTGIPVGSDLRFVPLADGSLDHELNDGNDFEIMERGICQSARQSESYCGRPADSPWGY